MEVQCIFPRSNSVTGTAETLGMGKNTLECIVRKKASPQTWYVRPTNPPTLFVQRCCMKFAKSANPDLSNSRTIQEVGWSHVTEDWAEQPRSSVSSLGGS